MDAPGLAAVEPFAAVEIGGVVHQILVSSAARGWSGLVVTAYQTAPQFELVAFPESFLAWHTLVLHLKGSLDLEWDLVGHQGRGYSYPGHLYLVPAHIPRAFSWSNTAHRLHVDLTPALIAATAAEISQTDPVRLELVPRFNFQDPLVQQLCLALLAEAESDGLAGRLYARVAGAHAGPASPA